MVTMHALLSVATFACASAKTALLVIDVQVCFLDGGSLSTPAKQIVPEINKMMAEKSCLFDDVFYSQDYHPENHLSFGSTHGIAPFAHVEQGNLPLLCIKPKSGLTADAACCPTVHINPAAVNCSTTLCPPEGWDYNINNSGIIQGNLACTQCRDNPEDCYQTDQAMWTDHCRDNGDSGFPANLNMGDNPKIVKKGTNQYVDAYSSFLDNSKSVETELRARLEAEGIKNLVVVGIATDVCVRESVLDAMNFGYTVTVVTDATAPVFGLQDPLGKANFDAAVKEMGAKGATVKLVSDILAMECPVQDEDAGWTTLQLVAIIGGVAVALGVVAFVAFRCQGGEAAPSADAEMQQELQQS